MDIFTEFHQVCNNYLTQIRAIGQYQDQAGQEYATPELSYRTDLHVLLRETQRLIGSSTVPVLEATKTTVVRTNSLTGEREVIQVGRPDFTLLGSGGDKLSPLGYVEAEAVGVNLDKLTGHAKVQNEIFRDCLDNFVLTNHLDFYLYVDGHKKRAAKLLKLPTAEEVQPQAAQELLALLTDFFEYQSYSELTTQIRSPHELALILARRTRQLRNEFLNGLAVYANADLTALYESFKAVLLPDLTAEEFADIYAQTITYGLFAARSAWLKGQRFTRHQAAQLIPESNPFLQQLFDRIASHELDDRIAWIADEIAALLRGEFMDKVLVAFGQRKGQEDVVLHFYETFLAAYDKNKRKVRGVYYTPEPVVSYIVRSVHELLQTHFHQPCGLADEETLILDPATGTGSFLFAVVNQIREVVRSHPQQLGGWRDYLVNTQLLKRLFGFELLLAPYVVAHLKLAMLLKETGYVLNSEQQERIAIYLTNALDQPQSKKDVLFSQFIATEAEQAAAIKNEKPILVVLGNPPYSNYGMMNKSGWILELLEAYKMRGTVRLADEEKKLNLNDDFIKFIRFGQWRIDKTGSGILAFVCNNTFIDGLTHRFMRESLLNSFDEIYILDLHGSGKKKEVCPDGSKDENVFDIQQGVCICLLVKRAVVKTGLAKVYHAELWGVRAVKYERLLAEDVKRTTWVEVVPKEPYFFLVPKVNTGKQEDEYNVGWSLKDIFLIYQNGIKTDRDALFIDFNKEVLEERIRTFYSELELTKEFKERYRVENSSSYPLLSRRVTTDFNKDKIHQCLYRPFDRRWLYYSVGLTSRPAWEVMQHISMNNNLTLLSCRQQAETGFHHVFCSNQLTECCAVSLKTREITSVFPLYLYETAASQKTLDNFGLKERKPNLTPAFLKTLADKLKLPTTKPYGLPKGISPEDIFYYAYAILHSPTYRSRYTEFLKIDFPRLPLTGNIKLFRDLAKMGNALVKLHLLEEVSPVDEHGQARYPFITQPSSLAAPTVIKVEYDKVTQRIYLNKHQYFTQVHPELWQCRVGGYQVCDKWLKDRKDRILTTEEITRYSCILTALAATMAWMRKIDERIGEFPII